ncbi:MAG: tRNA (N6-threonylcarbamoyladenosine(37)-N6)-methyltransferase TrmO [Candidatus Aminicenantales bacterium]
MEMKFTPVGIVHSPFKKKDDIAIEKCIDPGGFDDVHGELEIYPAYSKGLEDIDGFSHLFVLFLFHRAERGHLLVRPPHDRKERGVFSTRSPHRPNPLGLSVVRLLERSGSTLKVAGVDMIEGTPILDIKPYTPSELKKNACFGWLEA